MIVKAKFFTTLRDITHKKTDDVEVPAEVTVEDFIAILSEKYGSKFTSYVYDQRGELKPGLQYLVNGRSITRLKGLKTLLKDGDVVAILPPTGGG